MRFPFTWRFCRRLQIVHLCNMVVQEYENWLIYFEIPARFWRHIVMRGPRITPRNTPSRATGSLGRFASTGRSFCWSTQSLPGSDKLEGLDSRAHWIVFWNVRR